MSSSHIKHLALMIAICSIVIVLLPAFAKSGPYGEYSVGTIRGRITPKTAPPWGGQWEVFAVLLGPEHLKLRPDGTFVAGHQGLWRKTASREGNFKMSVNVCDGCYLVVVVGGGFRFDDDYQFFRIKKNKDFWNEWSSGGKPMKIIRGNFSMSEGRNGSSNEEQIVKHAKKYAYKRINF